MERLSNIISDNFQAHIVWLENALSIGVQYVYYVYVHKQARNCKHYKHGHRWLGGSFQTVENNLEGTIPQSWMS